MPFAGVGWHNISVHLFQLRKTLSKDKLCKESQLEEKGEITHRAGRTLQCSRGCTGTRPPRSCRGCYSRGPRTRCAWWSTRPPSSPGNTDTPPPRTHHCCCTTRDTCLERKRVVTRVQSVMCDTYWGSNPDHRSQGRTHRCPAHTRRDQSSPGGRPRSGHVTRWRSSRDSGPGPRHCTETGTSGRSPDSSSPPDSDWAVMWREGSEGVRVLFN